MRQIKFRGKRIDNGEWVYGYLYELPLESGNVCMILTTDNIHKDNSTEPQYHLAFTLWKDLFVVDSSTVGQFTGLYDKNGKEIYEGDIIEATSILGGSIGRKMKCSVDYYNDFACFIFVASDRRRFICTSISDIVVEVIGNIYDNPELLKN